MRLGFLKKRLGCLGIVAAACLLAPMQVRAETLAQQVQDFPGKVYNTYAWQVTSGSISSGTFTITGNPLQDESTPFFSPADGFSNPLIYPTTVTAPAPAGVQNVTDIIDPTDNDNPGTIAININAGDPSADYLVEEIDVGYNNNQPENMKPLFLSTTELGFGLESANVYWFAFLGFPSTVNSPAGALIGGLIENTVGGDIKTFDVVPAPNSAVGGMALMTLMGAAVAWRRCKSRSLVLL